MRDIVRDERFQTVVVATAYVVGALLTRWLMIAVPYRNYLRARIATAEAELAASAFGQEVRAAATILLDGAKERLDQRELLTWGRGRERAALMNVLATERIVERNRALDGSLLARAVAVDAELRQLPASKRPKPVIDRLEAVLAVARTAPPGDPAFVELNALTDRGLACVHEHTSSMVATSLAYHRKSFLVLCTAYLVTTAVGALVERPVVLLVGALGAVVSRLLYLVRTKEVPKDYTTMWTVLLLSPFAGALAAYGGLLLINLLLELDIAGDSVTALAWPAADAAATVPFLGAAFVLGFSERLLDRLARRTEDELVPAAATPPGGAPGTTGDAADPTHPDELLRANPATNGNTPPADTVGSATTSGGPDEAGPRGSARAPRGRGRRP